MTAAPTLATARRLVQANATLGALHHAGHAWVCAHWMPAVARLAASRQKAHHRTAARAYALLGDVHDLNGAPRAAVRAYHRALKLWPQHVEAWHGIGCMLDNMGRFKEARHALRRAAKLRPDDELIAGEIERVEWALLHGCPVLYEERSVMWRAAEALAAGHHNKALSLVGRRRSIVGRQLRARILAVRGDVARAIGEWERIAASKGTIQLRHADWYYTLRGPVGERAELWQLMLWKIRGRLEGGAFSFSPSLAELDLSGAKRFELHVRYELARCEGDVRALLALAGTYPTWREPGEAALRLDPGPTKHPKVRGIRGD